MFDLRAGILLSGATCVLCGMVRDRCACGAHDHARRMGEGLRAF